MIRIETAKPEDQLRLMELLLNNGMEYVDPVEAFMVAREGEAIVGCLRLEQHHLRVEMIRPLVVDEVHRGRGIGRLLLERSLSRDKPTVIAARGDAVGFYSTLGFRAANWKIIPDVQKEECACCPENCKCSPCPMVYNV